MNTEAVVSFVALGVSVAIPLLRLGDWALRADPRFLMSLGRQLLGFANLASIPCFVLLVVYQQWTPAIVLGAVLLMTPAASNMRSSGLWTMFRTGWQRRVRLDDSPGGYGPSGGYRPSGGPFPDADLARRAAIVLQDYLAYTGHADSGAETGALPRDGNAPRLDQAGPMGTQEALAVLGLNEHATAAEIGFAHRRLMMLMHPDRGGTNYLATKINKAKDVLLVRISESGDG